MSTITTNTEKSENPSPKKAQTAVKNEMEKYEVIELLGEGSFGRVYKAKLITDASFVALKVISKGRRPNKEIIGLRKECEIQRTLHHPNIIQMLDSFETAREIVVVTEFAQKELHMLLGKEGYLSEEKAQPIICDLVSALNYLHSQRVLHRDLKPQNVLIDSDNRAKLCDFGFARNMSTKTHVLTSIKGTPLYMAPELMEGQAYDFKADLWSLGCIMYEIVVGAPPFCFATSILHLIRLMHYEQIQWPTYLTEDCLRFLKGLLQKDPTKRFNWEEILAESFVKDKILISENDNKPLTRVMSANTLQAKEEQMQNHISSRMQAMNMNDIPEKLQLIEESHPIEAEEWIAFLRKTMEEILNEELTTLIQPSLLSIIVSPLRNSNSDSNVILHVVKLLSLPYSMSNIDESLTQILKSYRDVKLVPNLVYASKLLLRHKTVKTPMESTESSPDLHKMCTSMSDLNGDDLECLNHIYMLLTYLCYLDNGFTSQTCDAIVILNVYDSFRLFLKMSKSKDQVAAHILAILTQILRMFPENLDLVEKIVLQENGIDFIELLQHNNPIIRERSCYLLLFLGRLVSSDKIRLLWNDILKETLEALLDDSCESVRNVAESTLTEFTEKRSL